MKKEKGFTLIEIVVVLAIIAALAAILTPMLFDYLKESKITRGKADVRNIAASITNFNRDMGVWPVYKDKPMNVANATVKVLRSNGNDAVDSGESGWNTEVAGDFQSLEDCLHKGIFATGANTYIDEVKKPNEWKGPYMTDFKADPWGNKYYVSTEGLKPGSKKAVFALSAGPNATIETLLSMDATGGGDTPFDVGGDDIAYRIR